MLLVIVGSKRSGFFYWTDYVLCREFGWVQPQQTSKTRKTPPDTQTVLTRKGVCENVFVLWECRQMFT